MSIEFVEDDGAKCTMNLVGDEITVTVELGGIELMEKFRCSVEPRFGIDVTDLEKADEITDELLDILRRDHAKNDIE